MLSIHCSNRLEILLEYLIQNISQQNSSTGITDPFVREIILVPNSGMARWITHNVAMHTGIAAHLAFPNPIAFFWQILANWEHELPETPVWNRENLHWRLMRCIPTLVSNPAFTPIKRYLNRNNPELRLFKLAQRIADLFEHYLLFRPELILRWETGIDNYWQALLWRAVAEDISVKVNWESLLQASKLNNLGGLNKPLPNRVSLFGFDRLAPVYVEILNKLANYTTVQVLQLNPARYVWFAGLTRLPGDIPTKTNTLKTNTLLSNLGQTKQAILEQLFTVATACKEKFVSPGDDSLLHRLQSDILELRDLRADVADGRIFDTRDASIQIHACHSPLREVQVLRDCILRFFETIPEIMPRDIVVMAPDMDLYAPYVEAVLGTGPQHIPWMLADISLNAASQSLFTGLTILLELPESRFDASIILSLLQIPAIQRRLKLDVVGLERILTWVRESGIRWGADAMRRKALGLPDENVNTWDFGLKRLFLGMAMTADSNNDLYYECSPYPDIEGGEVVYLGILQTFFERLVYWQQRLQSQCSLEGWLVIFNELCTDIFLSDKDEQNFLRDLRIGLENLVNQSTAANFTGIFSVALFHTLLVNIQQEIGQRSQRMLTGQVTFCRLESLRSIPFRVICLLGMNDGDFPRRQHSLSFDLTAQSPRSTDISRRQDDNAIFLDAILAARDCLYISYLGRNVRNNSLKHPSVIVSDLIDYINQTHIIFGVKPVNNGELNSHILAYHPLQPFSPRAFDKVDPRLQSYAGEWLNAACSKAEINETSFSTLPLKLPDASKRTVDLNELIRCLELPARYFLTESLKIKLPREEPLQENIEPFTLNNLQLYNLNQTLLPMVQTQRTYAEILSLVRATGVLPHGAIGERLLFKQLQEVQNFANTITPYINTKPLEPLEIDLIIGDFRLQGILRGLSANGLFDQRLSALTCKHRLGLWVKHLVLCALRPPQVALTSIYVAKNSRVTLIPVEDPLSLLADLLNLRWQALMMPVAFFPESSLACHEYGLDSAKFRNKWDKSYDLSKEWSLESQNSAIKMAFRGINPIDGEFVRIANRIFQPLLRWEKILDG